MKIIKNVPVLNRLGKELRVDVEVWTRDGTESPTTYILHYNGRRITPFEQRIRGWSFTLNGLFKLVYSEHLERLIPTDSFMKIILDKSSGSLYPLPHD